MKYHHLDEHLWFQSFADSRVSNAEIIAQLIAVNWGFRYFKLQILRTPRLWAAPMGVWRISIKELPQVSGGKNLIETATKYYQPHKILKKTSQIYTNMTFFHHPSGLPEKSFALSDCWPKTCSVYHIQDAIQDAISLVLVFPWFFVTVVAKDKTYLPWKAGKLNCEFDRDSSLSFDCWYTSMSWWFISCS